MKMGDLYLKHVRGSRYVFNYGKLFYKYPGGAKNYVLGDWSQIFADLCNVKQTQNGRVIINEEKEIVIYRKEDNGSWRPYYVDQLKNEMKFEGIENNPYELRPGLLWTGFASHHGSKFNLQSNGYIHFKETYFEEGAQTTKKYRVKHVDEDLIDRLFFLKGNPGSFRINEYGHVWAPVELEVINNYNTDIINISDIKSQFKKLTKFQKNTLSKYSAPVFNKFTKKETSWYPIYIGKYPDLMELSRKDRPHTIINPDDIFE